MSKECVAAAGIYCGMGVTLPIVPTAIAVIAVLIVRILVWTKNKSKKWNIAVCLLAILAAASTMEGTKISVFQAFWIGVGYGALGVGIIEVGKSTTFKEISARFGEAFSVLLGIKK